jgi:hypothetical protein
MLTPESLPVLVFLSIVAAVYVLAASTVIRWILHKFNLVSLSNKTGLVWLRRIVLVLALLGLLCMAYGYFIEPYWPTVTRIQITSSKLAVGSKPLRIVHISDLHSDPKVRLEERLPDLISREDPDAIVFTGDCINSPEGLPVFRECLTKLSSIAPTFAVKGNWDSVFWRHLDLFEGTGVTELNGNAVALDVPGSPVWIAGVAVGDERQTEQTLDSMPDEAFTLFLYHYPDLIPEIAAQRVDLYCAGHTHGGQVALPVYGALITLSKFGKKYEAGLYKVDNTWMYVNRGIGMEGGIAPRVRFWARPEVTVIDVRPSN